MPFRGPFHHLHDPNFIWVPAAFEHLSQADRGAAVGMNIIHWGSSTRKRRRRGELAQNQLRSRSVKWQPVSGGESSQIQSATEENLHQREKRPVLSKLVQSLFYWGERVIIIIWDIIIIRNGEQAQVILAVAKSHERISHAGVTVMHAVEESPRERV